MMRRKAFTLSELLVAMGLMVALLAGAGVVFHSAVQSQRASIALSEIMRKFHGITDQLNADFRGMRKEGEIAIFWVAAKDGSGGYNRFDRMMFFADGDFQSYNAQPVVDYDPADAKNLITGNTARICYMLSKDTGDNNKRPKELATDGSGNLDWKKIMENRRQRVLSRTQHIMTSDAVVQVRPEYIRPYVTVPFDPVEFENHNFQNEYDNSYVNLQEWEDIPTRLRGDILADPIKENIISIEMDLDTVGGVAVPGGGPTVYTDNSATIHMFFCEGVGDFKVQGWYDADGSGPVAGRWFPDVNPDGDADVNDDSDFFTSGSVINETNFPGLIYPGQVTWNNPTDPSNPNVVAVDGANFLTAPGLGRAFKFTFTLYDSRGIYKNGKTFTHIVWLDN